MADGLESQGDQVEGSFSSPWEWFWMSELIYEKEKLDLRVVTYVVSAGFGGWLKITR